MSKFRVGGSRFSRFMNGKGFYIALALCLVAIGSAAYVAVNKSVGFLSGGASESSSAYSQAASSYSWETDSQTQQTNQIVSGVTGDRTSSETNSEASSSAVSSSESSKNSSSKGNTYVDADGNKLIFVLPCDGTVINSYSSGNLVYNKTLEDYRVHNGIDIAAKKGTTVVAAADGKVVSISSSFELGEQVVIDHGNGLKSIYANLTTAVTVKKNQKVEAGDVVGCVGNTAQSELALESHLHFAMMDNGKYIDPVTVLGLDSK